MATDRQVQNGKSVLRSWLHAAKVAYTPTTNGVIINKSGRAVEIGHITKLNSGVVTLDGSVLAGPDTPDAVRYFIESLAELGIEVKIDQIVRNGDLSTFGKRTRASACIEDVILRHNEFRVAPNPDPTAFAHYRPMIKKAVREIGYRFQPLLQRLSWDREDLEQYASIWVINYMHKYARGVSSEDIALAKAHIYQRFGEMMLILRRQERNVLPDEGTLHACDEDLQFVPVSAGGDDTKFTLVGIKEYDPIELMEPEPEVRVQAPAARLNQNKKVFAKLFGNLTKEQQIEKLEEVYSNDHCDPNARSLAARMLKKLGKTDVEEDMGDIEGAGI